MELMAIANAKKNLNRLYLTFLLNLFNFDLSFTHKPIFHQSTAVFFAAVIV